MLFTSLKSLVFVSLSLIGNDALIHAACHVVSPLRFFYPPCSGHYSGTLEWTGMAQLFSFTALIQTSPFKLVRQPVHAATCDRGPTKQQQQQTADK